jgi:hypothetical protein
MNPKNLLARHCERSEAIQRFNQIGVSGLPRRYAPRTDDLFSNALLDCFG